MSIGSRIKTAREQRDMTLEEVAKCCNTTKQTIFKYENEIVTNIPYDKVVLLSKALNVTPSYLFGWDEPSTPQNEQPLNEAEKSLLELFRQVPQESQQMVLQMIRVALGKQ